jgi:adenine phosphoribosyltransferase
MKKCILLGATESQFSDFEIWNMKVKLFDHIDKEIVDDSILPIFEIHSVGEVNVVSLKYREKEIMVANLNDLYLSLPNFLMSFVTIYYDFPKPDIVFTDMWPFFEDPFLSSLFVTLAYDKIKCAYGEQKLDYVLGLEARGFVMGGMLASALNCGFVPVRKPGKLPGEVIGREYTKNYGVDKLEMSKKGMRQNANILIVDDMLATGGSISATIRLLDHFKPADIKIFVISHVKTRIELAKETLKEYYAKTIILCP